jgi:HEAT repeat protein
MSIPDVKKLKAKQDVKGLIEALGYQEYKRVRQEAAMALGEIGDVRAAEPLIAALSDDEDRHVREAAGEALVKLGAVSVQPLIEALGDWKSILWRPIPEILGRIGAPAFEPLTLALQHKKFQVRQQAADALGFAGDARAFEALSEALNDEDADVRCSAALALGKIGEARAVDTLAALLGDKQVRKAAAEALGILGDPRAFDHLAALPSYHDSRVEIAVALAKTDSVRAFPLLVSMLNSGDSAQKAAAVAGLGYTKDPQAMEFIGGAIITYGGSPDFTVAAVRALGDIGANTQDPAVRVAVMKKLMSLRDGGGYQNTRDAARRALASLGT